MAKKLLGGRGRKLTAVSSKEAWLLHPQTQGLGEGLIKASDTCSGGRGSPLP